MAGISADVLHNQKTQIEKKIQNLDAGGEGEHGDDGGAAGVGPGGGGGAGAPGGTEIEVVTDPAALQQQPPGQGPNRERITTRYLTKYERARVLGTRALQIR